MSSDSFRVKLAREILAESTETKLVDGGLPPKGKAQLEAYEHADLITLPEGVSGTNCGNCKYVRESKEGHHCSHHDLDGYSVTARMCCAYWDNEGVKRAWKP